MSWSYTVNGSIDTFELPLSLIHDGLRGHPAYPLDMLVGLNAAKAAGMKSATITGYRTPNPYGGPETIAISVMGFTDPVDLNDLIRNIVLSGPEEGSPGAAAGRNDQHDDPAYEG